MKNTYRYLFVAALLLFVTIAAAQPKSYPIRNGIGIQAGLSMYNIQTDNFITDGGQGIIGGMAATVDLPHKWYTVSYGMLFSEQRLDIQGRPSDDVAGAENVAFKLKMIQLAFLFHAKLAGDMFTLDVGPQLQYNGELEFKNSSQESYFANNYEQLPLKDVTDISRFNANGVVGASIGVGQFKFRAHYIYGFTNILNKLNNNNLNTAGGDPKFKGNQNLLAFTLVVTL